MKRILLLFGLLLVSVLGMAQAPSNYTNINGRYRWIAGMFDSTFSLPKGATPSLRTGGSTNPGALFYRTTDSTVKYWTGSQWLTVADTSRFVPYNGAIDTLNMGQFGVKTKFVQFDTSSRDVTDRTLLWSNDDGVLQYGMTNGGSLTQRIGLEQFARVKNVDATQINKGDVVYIFGASGDRASVKKADNRQDATSSKTLGVATENIAVNGVGFVGTFGVISNLNLAAYTPGDILYLDSIPGQVTKTKPQAPYHMVFVGVVERANAGDGRLFVNVQNGYELEELHNVRITAPVRNNALLAYDSVRALWVDTTFSAIGIGTVSSVATNNGTGITGGTITTTGTIAADTLLLSTRAWRQKGIDSIRTNFVPYTGATTNVDLNTKILSSGFYKVTGNGVSSGGYLGFQQYNGTTSGLSGHTTISALGQNSLILSYAQSPSGSKTARLSSSLISTDSSYEYSFPNKGGTFAMTSDVTGAISGTTNYIPKFTSSSAIGNSVIYDNSGNIGIGTTAANVILEVGGLVADVTKTVFRSSLGGAPTNYFNDITAIYSGASAEANKLQINYANGYTSGTGIVLQGDGKVGIGTSSPDQKLVVQGSNVSLKIADGTYSSFIATISSNNAYGNGSVTGQLYLRGQSGIGFTGNGGSSTQMTLDASGNLGLGVSPSAWGSTFKSIDESAGNLASFSTSELYLTQNGYNNTGWKYTSTGFSSQYLQVSGQHRWLTAASGTAGNAISFTQAMTLDASGNLGIGTSTTSSSFLNIANSGPQNEIQFRGTAYTNVYSETTNGFQLGITSLSSAALEFYTNNSEKMRITSGGNVGIGTTSPSEKLQVLGNVRLTSNNLTTANTLSSEINNFNGSSNQFKSSSIKFLTGSFVDQGHITFNTSIGGVDQERVRIAETGNVGIGTTSPSGKLNVSGISSGVSVRMDNTASYSAFLAYINGTDYIGVDNLSGAMALYAGSSERMRITSGGNVSVNTTQELAQFNIKRTASGSTARALALYNNVATSVNTGVSLEFYPNGGDNDRAAIISSVQSTSGNYADLRFSTSNDAAPVERLRLTASGNAEFSGSIKTAAPSGYTAKPWKLGERVATAVTLDSGQYIAVEIDGVTYYLATVTIN